MVKVEERERIRRAYFVEKRGIRQIARDYRHGRCVVREAIKESGVPFSRFVAYGRRRVECPIAEKDLS